MLGLDDDAWYAKISMSFKIVDGISLGENRLTTPEEAELLGIGIIDRLAKGHLQDGTIWQLLSLIYC